MIYIALYLLYAFLLLFVKGLLAGRFLNSVLRVRFSFTSLGFTNTLLLGIVSLTTILSYLSLIWPVNTVVHLIILVSLAGYALFNRKYVLNAAKAAYTRLQHNRLLLFAGGICLLAGIVFASGPVKAYDTGLYHAQSVKWINEYGVVPGLGNLHYRLAFNSAWLVFSSFFDILAFDGKSYHLVNLLIFIIGVAICLQGLADIINNKIKLSSVLSSLLVLFFFARYKEIASLSTDFPATSLLLFTLVLAVKFIEAKDEPEVVPNLEGDLPPTYFLVVIFTLFALTIKLSVTPILLFPLFLYLIAPKRDLRTLVFSGLLSVTILLPFFLRNLILSGYLIFPFPDVDIFSFDWQVPSEHALTIKQQTRYLINSPGVDGVLVPDVSFGEWIARWFKLHIQKNLELTFYLLVSPLLFIPFWLVCIAGGRYKENVNVLLIQAVLAGGVIFWLVSGPVPRLGAGWILSFGVFPVAVLLHKALAFKPQTRRFLKNSYLAYGFLVLFCLWMISVAGFRARLIGEDAYLIWTIESLPQVDLDTVATQTGLEVYVPVEGNQAWDADLPSTPYFNDHLEMRGETIDEGFRVRDQ